MLANLDKFVDGEQLCTGMTTANYYDRGGRPGCTIDDTGAQPTVKVLVSLPDFVLWERRRKLLEDRALGGQDALWVIGKVFHGCSP